MLYEPGNFHLVGARAERRFNAEWGFGGRRAANSPAFDFEMGRNQPGGVHAIGNVLMP